MHSFHEENGCRMVLADDRILDRVLGLILSEGEFLLSSCLLRRINY